MSIEEEFALAEKAEAEGEELYGGQDGLYYHEFYLLPDKRVVEVSYYHTTDMHGAHRGNFLSVDDIQEMGGCLGTGLRLALEKRGIAVWGYDNLNQQELAMRP